MLCEHLQKLEQEMIDAGVEVVYRGQAWSKNCREWVYFDCCIDLAAVRKRMDLPECVVDHEHLGTHDGCESGFYCSECQDAIMGHHPKSMRSETRVYQ